MKLRKIFITTLFPIIATCLASCTFKIGDLVIFSTENDTKTDNNFVVDTDHINEYYSSLNSNLSENNLLSALRTLNLSKRTSQASYEGMSTSASGKFKFTDYDPSTAKVNSKGITYGTKVLSFYSGVSTSTFNREHVWPKSHGGDLVEDDIYMVRPTVSAENSDRGNSAYVTGMCTEHNGWDPITAFGSESCYKGIRGECARIIFYCMTASSDLTLVASNSLSNNSMGNLTNLVQWACDDEVNDREKRRNEGGEYVQGNRNPFVDHPEYVCKIWGKTNAATKKACGIN